MLSFLSRAFAVFSGFILAGLVCLVCTNVVLRYVFNSPIIWADQITGYGMVYITFLGSPWVLYRRRHISVDVLQETLGGSGRLLLGAVLGLLGFVYCAGFGYLAWSELGRLLARDSQFADAIVIPQWTVYWTIVAGSVLMALEFAIAGLQDLRAWWRRDHRAPGAVPDSRRG